MKEILYAVLVLGIMGAVFGAVLAIASKVFAVKTDERLPKLVEALPGANCGGCGFAGCRGMADALVKQDDISALFCPVGGGDCMKAVAAYLGKSAPEKEPQVATVRCGGTCDKRPRTNEYNGAKSCAVASSLYIGQTGCAFGCLGFGDCVVSCAFDAIRMNPATGLPEVDPDKCTACGACVKACPKMIIELRKKWPKNRAVYVSCVSKDKGAVVMKACKAGCIGCGKCQKVCAFGAITIENNLAYIDPQKCKLCRKCVNECPTGAIVLAGMDPLPKAPKAPAAPKAAPAAAKEAPAAAQAARAPKSADAAPADAKGTAPVPEAAPKAAPAAAEGAPSVAPKAPVSEAVPAVEKEVAPASAAVQEAAATGNATEAPKTGGAAPEAE